MRMTTHLLGNLPKLAWVVSIHQSTEIVSLYHGPWVEIRDSFFIEGVWNGSFAQGGFDQTDCIFGSGGVLRDDSLTLVSSGSTTDYLYYCKRVDVLLAANSLPLLLALTGNKLDIHNPDYAVINESIKLGIGLYRREIPTTGDTIQRLIYRNLKISSGGIEEIDKPWPSHFTCYTDYFDYVNNNYSIIATNARDPERKRPLQIFSTQSRGYDTTAVNAIAAQYGIDQVFTISKGKGSGRFAENDEIIQSDDDGTEICDILGLLVTPIERRVVFTNNCNDEYLYYCTIHGSEDVFLMGIVNMINTPSLLLTGTLGELLYPRSYYFDHCKNMRISELERGDLGGGHGLTEVRLAKGFIDLPLFYIGARRRDDIMNITESSDMDRWRLGNSYDRPISRRIAEDVGIPRQQFGQKKMTASVELTPPYLPANTRLREEYLNHLLEYRILRSWQIWTLPLVHRINAIIWFISPCQYRWLYYLERAISKLIRRDFHFPMLLKKVNSGLFCYCVNKRADEYACTISDHILPR